MENGSCLGNTGFGKRKKGIDNRITNNSFSRLEQEYIRLKDLHTRIPSRIDDWIDLLDTDQEGEPIYSARGEAKSRYRPDNEDIIRINSLSEDALSSTRNILANFIISLSPQEQSLLVKEIMLHCLKNLEAVKIYIAVQAIGNAGDQDNEDDVCTVIDERTCPITTKLFLASISI